MSNILQEVLAANQSYAAEFGDKAKLAMPPARHFAILTVRITLPDGTIVNSEQPGVNQIFSKVLKREVKLCALPDVQTATAEEYWPDIEGLDHRDIVTDFGLPEGTFFDCALVHLLTLATLDRLRELYPQGSVRGPTVSPKLRGGDRERPQGFRGECLDRAGTRDRGCRSPQHHGSPSALRDDNTPSGRSPKGYGDPAYSSAAQPG
jgi:hypothetical protein